MNRRNILKYVATGVVLSGAGGAYWLSKERDYAHLTIDAAIDKLDSMTVGSIENSSAWEISRVFGHLSQGIEFSMTGYPEPKAEIFQKTVGKLAFNVFQARGKMNHDLGEPIPGEVITKQLIKPSDALNELKQSLLSFRDFDGALKPHFAYGSLNKGEYSAAHVMHINNHLEELKNA
ncbi:MAG: DUF1569 domain-containing protein [Rhizobiaceae bacterium]